MEMNMSKIEDALEKARKLRESLHPKRFEPLKENTLVNIDNPLIVSVTQPDSHAAEQFRKLKSIVIRETKRERFLNTIMIASAIDSEGKSLTAINLAISLAQEIDHSVLLVDADFRKPLIHEYLGIEPKYGLSDYLNHDVDISEIMIKTGIGNMVIVPAGKKVQNPVELISSMKMKSFMNEVKHRYVDRYIIVDTPPLLPFAEAIALGSIVDGTIFVIKEGYAQIENIHEALNLMKNINMLGLVFNCASTDNLDGYYSRY
jgi:exopolysaccharide/PEP-CTERM locus tyrosine autokinase